MKQGEDTKMKSINHNENKFFTITSGKIGLTIALGILIFLVGAICSPGYFIGGTNSYPCGQLLANLSRLIFVDPLSIIISIALIYLLSSLIIYLWKRSQQ